ncbi:MAG: dTDP-4-dehydrorhamnose reductase [Ilumatobacter sp.]
MRVIVTGAEGQLGHDVVAECQQRGHEVAAFGRVDLDLTSHTDADERLAATSADVVVNCAAMTAVDACETEVERAHAVNEHGVRRLAVACDRHGARLIHVSTDYVFDGDLDRPYVEDDATGPRSVYGQSKLAGEEAVANVLGDRGTVVRTSWVCGEHGANMVKLVRRLAPAGNPLAFVDDQRGCPSFTADLAPGLLDLASDASGGVFHLTNAGAVSWYEFVAEVLEASGFDRSQVSPISTAELDPPRPAPRPMNSVLENRRWVAAGRTPLRDFREPLAELCERLSTH